MTTERGGDAPAATVTCRLPEYALTEAEGAALYAAVAPILDAGQPVLLDLEDTHVLCTHWLSGFYGPLFDRFSEEGIRHLVRVRNTSQTNQEAITHMFRAARRWRRERGIY
jgi:hypothetical protein